MLKIIFFATFALTHVYGLELNYYWKDYIGQIPQDAVVGGQNLRGDNIYIGQAYIKEGGQNGGIIVVEIQPNVTEVSVPFRGVKKSRFGLKVLCSSNPRQLTWIRSNSSLLHLDLIDKHAVIGGVEDGNVLYIGRVFNNAETRIGKVGSFIADESMCLFVSGGQEQHARSFEVLIMDLGTSDIEAAPSTTPANPSSVYESIIDSVLGPSDSPSDSPNV